MHFLAKTMKYLAHSILLLFYLLKKGTSAHEEGPIVPRSGSFFEVKNWTDLLNREYENQTVPFANTVGLFELKNGMETLIGKVSQHGRLYNDIEEVSLCQRRVFQIKVNGAVESDPLVWTPLKYHIVR